MFSQQLLDRTLTWSIQMGVSLPTGPTEARIFSIGDTVTINGNECHEVLYGRTDTTVSPFLVWTHIRVDSNGFVYDCIDGKVVSAFNLSLGQLVQDSVPFSPDYTVVKLDSILLLNGQTKRRYYLIPSISSDTIVWIEDIGSIYAPHIPTSVLFSDGISYINCIYQNGTIIYNSPLFPNCTFTRLSTNELEIEEYSVSPNPTSGQLRIEGISRIQKIELYSIHGKFIQRITNTESINIENLQNGIYLVKIVDEDGKPTFKKIQKE
jgi:hypothetical protein